MRSLGRGRRRLWVLDWRLGLGMGVVWKRRMVYNMGGVLKENITSR